MIKAKVLHSLGMIRLLEVKNDGDARSQILLRLKNLIFHLKCEKI